MALRYKVLLVDDEPELLKTFKLMLAKDGFTVLCASSASEALLAAVDSKPDIILSDVVMPDVDGKQLLRRLRADARTSGIPVVLMSGTLVSDAARAEGRELGADDYLTKPSSPRLMTACLRSVLRRYEAPEELRETLAEHGLELDVSARTASLRGRRISLTRKEFDLLTVFLRRQNRVLSAPYLLETVWGYDPAEYNDPRTVVVHVSSLKKKLGSALGKRLVSVPGLGYRFEAA